MKRTDRRETFPGLSDNANKFTVIRSSRKTLCVTVGAGGEVTVKAPRFLSDRRIREFIAENSSFIENARAKALSVSDAAEAAGPYTEADIRKMKDKAASEFPGIVKLYADKLGVSFGRITVRRQKTKWGSCSSGKNINLNILLCDCPENVMHSVIAHEVCHLKHMDHGKDFYRELYAIFPDYDKCRKWLKDNGSLLNRRYELYLSSKGK